MDEIVKKTAVGILAVALFAGGLVWWAFAFVTAWGWLAVPLFGAPHLTMMQALAISLLKAALWSGRSNKKIEITEFMAHVIAGPAFILGMAWIYTLFM
jgi:hypothetical protein